MKLSMTCFALLAAALTGAAACTTDTPVATEDSGPPTLLPGSMCAPACTAMGPPFADQTEFTCYDGCNWCDCSTEGPIHCTARACLDASVDAGPDAGDGVCCPIGDLPCHPGIPLGGWAPTMAECDTHVSTWFDGYFDRGLDEHGCDTWTNQVIGGGEFCCGCVPDADWSTDGGT